MHFDIFKPHPYRGRGRSNSTNDDNLAPWQYSIAVKKGTIIKMTLNSQKKPKNKAIALFSPSNDLLNNIFTLVDLHSLDSQSS